MVSRIILALTALAASASALEPAAPQEQSSGITAKRQSDFFEVTSCHGHGDVLFCIYDGEEWEVTSGVDAASAPESFEGCHNHSEHEM